MTALTAKDFFTLGEEMDAEEAKNFCSQIKAMIQRNKYQILKSLHSVVDIEKTSFVYTRSQIKKKFKMLFKSQSSYPRERLDCSPIVYTNLTFANKLPRQINCSPQYKLWCGL